MADHTLGFGEVDAWRPSDYRSLLLIIMVRSARRLLYRSETLAYSARVNSLRNNNGMKGKTVEHQ